MHVYAHVHTHPQTKDTTTPKSSYTHANIANPLASARKPLELSSYTRKPFELPTKFEPIRRAGYDSSSPISKVARRPRGIIGVGSSRWWSPSGVLVGVPF